jgi:hypothetical protein
MNYGAIGSASVTNGVLQNLQNATIDSVFINKDSTGTVAVHNWNFAHIGTAEVVRGWLSNSHTASIGTVYATGNAIVTNNNNATIGTISIADRAALHNRDSAYVGNVFVDGNRAGSSANVVNQGSARIDTMTVTGWGRVNNLDSARISTVDIVGHGRVTNQNTGSGISDGIGRANVTEFGTLENFSGARVTSMTVADYGQVTNYSGATINNAMMTGGTVNNAGQIDRMTYVGGTYVGTIGDQEGSIGSLNIAGNWQTGSFQGSIDHLIFDSSGTGLLTISAFVENSEPGFMGFSAMSAASTPNIGFYGIEAQSVDLTYGNIALDLSGLAVLGNDLASAFANAFGLEGFSLVSLFNAETVTGSIEDIVSFRVGFGKEWFTILNDGVLDEAWSFVGGNVILSGEPQGGGSEVPEPATLAIIGLGLAGLGLARRRRK